MIRRHITPALVACLSCLGICFTRPLVGSAWTCLLPLLLVSGAVFIVSCHNHATRVAIILGSLCVGTLIGLVSLARMSDARDGSFLPVRERDVSSFRGSVSEDSSLSQKGYSVVRVSLRAAASALTGVVGQAQGSVLLLVAGDFRFSIGQILDVTAPLSDMTDGNMAQRFVARAERRAIVTHGYTSPVWLLRSRIRGWLHGSVSLAGYPSSALLEALLIGGRDDVPGELHQSFQRTGSLHILALSGMHVTVLYGVIGGLLFFLRDRRAKLIVATIFLLLYQFIAGFMPSLLRATVMIVVGGVALLGDRDREGMNLLSIAGLVLILIDPFEALFTLVSALIFGDARDAHRWRACTAFSRWSSSPVSCSCRSRFLSARRLPRCRSSLVSSGHITRRESSLGSSSFRSPRGFSGRGLHGCPCP